MKDNRWPGGKVGIELDSQYRGASGALLRVGQFDERIGKEAFLLIMEDAAFARELSIEPRIEVAAAGGVIHTKSGPMAYIVWTLSGVAGGIVEYEHFLNCFESEMVGILESASEQTYLKVMIADADSLSILKLLQFKNIFDLGAMAAAMDQIASQESGCDFDAARGEVQARYTTAQLKS